MLKTLKTPVTGYEAASAKTGISAHRLRRMVSARQIRVIKSTPRSQVMFFLEDLLEDIEAMTVPKIT